MHRDDGTFYNSLVANSLVGILSILSPPVFPDVVPKLCLHVLLIDHMKNLIASRPLRLVLRPSTISRIQFRQTLPLTNRINSYARYSSKAESDKEATHSTMEAIKNTIVENFGGAAQGLAKPEQKFDIEKDVPDLSGKVAAITGGSEGIGYAAVFSMLKAGLKKVFIMSPSKEVMDGALKDISEKLGAEYAKRVQWIQLDLADWQATTKAAQTIRDSTDRLDILSLNAARGIMTYQLTDYGVDRHMAVNHFGHVILTSHLLPLLKSTASSSNTVRIHIQASNAHQGAPSDVKFESLDELNTDLGPNGQYGRSKLAAILYARYMTKHLHAENPNIVINSTHPGFVETKMSIDDIHEPYPILGYGMSVAMSPFKKDQWEGSASLLYTVTKTVQSGQYVCPPAIVEPGSSMSQDEELGERLMKLTRDVVRQKFAAQSVEKGCPLKDY